MSFRFRSVLLISALLAPAAAAQDLLRVCADPNNLPFSDDKQQGFENKLAELIASKLNDKLEYTWWSERKSFLKNSLDAGRCDVVMGVPASLDTVAVTRPYYRSAYVFVSREDRDLRIRSLHDGQLAHLKIGMPVVGDDYAPPAVVLARRGITENIVGYSLFGEYGAASPGARIIEAVDRGDIDLAIVWGPVAGYFAKTAESRLDITPVSPPSFLGVPFSYDMAIAVRKKDTELRQKLDQVLESEFAAVQDLLSRYGVPQVH